MLLTSCMVTGNRVGHNMMDIHEMWLLLLFRFSNHFPLLPQSNCTVFVLNIITTVVIYTHFRPISVFVWITRNNQKWLIYASHLLRNRRRCFCWILHLLNEQNRTETSLRFGHHGAVIGNEYFLMPSFSVCVSSQTPSERAALRIRPGARPSSHTTPVGRVYDCFETTITLRQLGVHTQIPINWRSFQFVIRNKFLLIIFWLDNLRIERQSDWK